MTARARPRASYADVLAAPPNMVAEVLFGVLYTHPRPAAKHTRAASSLGGELHGPFDRGRGGPGGWVILDEPELHLGEDIIVPDLAGWRRERISESTKSIDCTDKMTIWARERVPHVWLLDPVARTLEVFRARRKSSKKKRERKHGDWTLVDAWRDDARVRAEPFEALSLHLESLWT